MLKELNCTNYSIFTGTAGENRKIVIEANNNGETEYFIKIPTTQSSIELVQREKDNLVYLEQFYFNTFDIPKVAFSDGGIIAISNIKPSHVIKSYDFSDIHFKVLVELYCMTFKKMKLITVNPIKKAVDHTQYLSMTKLDLNNKLHIKVDNLKTNLLKLKNIILQDQIKEIAVSFSHCDFTPWNMYITKDKLFVYDWELASHDTPLLFDFFHYIFQQGILVKHLNYLKIKQEIKEYFANETLKEIVITYNIDINKYYGFYLLINTSYYLLKYVNQKDLHIQAHWLIDVWHDALNNFVEKKGEVFEFN
jgi:hypothetical protein